MLFKNGTWHGVQPPSALPNSNRQPLEVQPSVEPVEPASRPCGGDRQASGISQGTPWQVTHGASGTRAAGVFRSSN